MISRIAYAFKINAHVFAAKLLFFLLLCTSVRTGTNGAGKGTVVEYLLAKHGFLHFSVRSYLTKVINERGLPLNRDTMSKVANELRAANKPSFFAEELVACARKDLAAAAAASRAGASTKIIGGAIIESIRTTGEVAALRDSGSFLLLAVDCPQKIRYEVRLG